MSRRLRVAAGAVVALAILVVVADQAQAKLYITEWMYNQTPEFFELTNLGSQPLDLTGYSYDDSDAVVGKVDISSLGILAPRESVLLTEATADAFRTRWGLAASVKVFGGITDNLGRADEINIWDNNGVLVDQLTYDDELDEGVLIRTQNISGNPATLAALGANDHYQWVLASVGDTYGSYASIPAGQVANPGVFALVPEPASLALVALGVMGAALRRRTR